MYEALTITEKATLLAKLRHAGEQFFEEGHMLGGATAAVLEGYGLAPDGYEAFYGAAADCYRAWGEVAETLRPTGTGWPVTT